MVESLALIPVEILLGRLIDKAVSFLWRRVRLVFNVREEVKFLRGILPKVRDLVFNVTDHDDVPDTTKTFLRALSDFVYHAEDILDEFDTEISRRRWKDNRRKQRNMGGVCQTQIPIPMELEIRTVEESVPKGQQPSPPVVIADMINVPPSPEQDRLFEEQRDTDVPTPEEPQHQEPLQAQNASVSGFGFNTENQDQLNRDLEYVQQHYVNVKLFEVLDNQDQIIQALAQLEAGRRLTEESQETFRDFVSDKLLQESSTQEEFRRWVSQRFQRLEEQQNRILSQQHKIERLQQKNHEEQLQWKKEMDIKLEALSLSVSTFFRNLSSAAASSAVPPSLPPPPHS